MQCFTPLDRAEISCEQINRVNEREGGRCGGAAERQTASAGSGVAGGRGLGLEDSRA